MVSSGREIVIAGAGPTGLTAAILLRQRGFDPIVLDRRSSLASLPAAHVANTRTLEVFAEMGVAHRVWSTGDTDAMSSKVVWAESMAGRQYGVLSILGAVHDPRGPLSAFRSVNIPQTWLEQILYDRLTELGGTVRFGEEVRGVTQADDRVQVEIASGAERERRAIECDWLLGCDGAGSAVRRSSAIGMVGPKTIARFMTIYFEADLDCFREGRRALLYWIGGPEVRGVFISFDQAGRMWAMLVPIGDLPLESFNDAAALGIVRKAIGDIDFAAKLTAVSSWNMSAQVADTFRRGRVLLAGDACHRFPPTGGLGMNTGIQDAHNLIWKLAAVMEGCAPTSFLNTYEQERRPVAQRNTDQSVHNLMKMAMIDDALGIATLAPIEAGAADGPVAIWPDATLRIDGISAEAAGRREAVQRAVDDQAEHFAQGAGLDLGFAYAKGAVVPDGSPPPSSGPGAYRPDGHPGARLPFSSTDGSFERSTLAAVAPTGVTLFARGTHWNDRADRAASRAAVPVKVVLLEEGNAFGPNTADLLGIGPNGAVAVRPDGHVLWRQQDLSDSAESEFAHALDVSHGRAGAAALTGSGGGA